MVGENIVNFLCHLLQQKAVIGNHGNTNGATLPEVIISNFSDRGVKPGLNAVDQTAKNLALFFEAVNLGKMHRESADRHYHLLLAVSHLSGSNDPFDFFQTEEFENVIVFDVIVVFDTDTTFVAGMNFFDIIFETFNRTGFAFKDFNAVTDNAH